MTNPESDADRIARLEAELARVKTERDMYKEFVYDRMRKEVPYEPMTEAEVMDMLNGPRGESLEDIIKEFTGKLGDK